MRCVTQGKEDKTDICTNPHSDFSSTTTAKRVMLLGDYRQMNKCDKTFEEKQK